jgi:4'-phosphopantetheinyl transferase
MRANVNYQEMANRYFSPYECAILQALPAEAQQEAFYRCWTRKEAYIKARGKGLSIPLDQFDVSLAPGIPAALLASREDPQAVNHWSLQALAPGEGYVGAIAVDGTDWHLYCWQW